MKVIEAQGFWERMLGLIPHKDWDEDSLLLFRDCRSIHTFFMPFSIDVIMVDKKGIIVRLEEGLRPWRFLFGGRDVKDLYEAKAGFIERRHLGPGVLFLKE